MFLMVALSLCTCVYVYSYLALDYLVIFDEIIPKERLHAESSNKEDGAAAEEYVCLANHDTIHQQISS